MHIILGALGTIVTILILFNRLSDNGIDIGWLNPFLWNRRRKWRKKYQGNPVYKIENPMETTAILTLAVVKADGDMTKDDKNLLLSLFESKFKLTRKDAAGLLISSAHLVGDGTEVREDVKKFLSPSKASFTESQAESAISLITQVAGNPDNMHPNTQELVHKINKEMQPHPSSNKTW